MKINTSQNINNNASQNQQIKIEQIKLVNIKKQQFRPRRLLITKNNYNKFSEEYQVDGFNNIKNNTLTYIDNLKQIQSTLKTSKNKQSSSSPPSPLRISGWEDFLEDTNRLKSQKIKNQAINKIRPKSFTNHNKTINLGFNISNNPFYRIQMLRQKQSNNQITSHQNNVKIKQLKQELQYLNSAEHQQLINEKFPDQKSPTRLALINSNNAHLDYLSLNPNTYLMNQKQPLKSTIYFLSYLFDGYSTSRQKFKSSPAKPEAKNKQILKNTKSILPGTSRKSLSKKNRKINIQSYPIENGTLKIFPTTVTQRNNTNFTKVNIMDAQQPEKQIDSTSILKRNPLQFTESYVKVKQFQMPKVMMTNISNTSNNNRQISNYMNPYNLHYNNLVNTRKLQNKISKNINIISLENNIVQKHTQNLIGQPKLIQCIPNSSNFIDDTNT